MYHNCRRRGAVALSIFALFGGAVSGPNPGDKISLADLQKLSQLELSHVIRKYFAH